MCGPIKVVPGSNFLDYFRVHQMGQDRYQWSNDVTGAQEPLRGKI